MKRSVSYFLILFILLFPTFGRAWHDETHIAIAKAAGYNKWYNAAGADMIKIKAGGIEKRNHYVNNQPGTVVTAEMVLEQATFYNKSFDIKGHLYGAIIASIREYRTTKLKGKYAEYHLAFCAHYVGDLSQPLHNAIYDVYNMRNHSDTDGVINDEVLGNLSKIEVYPVEIKTEQDLAREIARIANLSMKLGYQLERDGRLLTKQEAYQQISHSASLFKGMLKWVEK